MTAKQIVTDLTKYNSPKYFRKILREMTLEFMANDEIDDRSEVRSFYVVLDNHLKSIQRYQKRKQKKAVS